MEEVAAKFTIELAHVRQRSRTELYSSGLTYDTNLLATLDSADYNERREAANLTKIIIFGVEKGSWLARLEGIYVEYDIRLPYFSESVFPRGQVEEEHDWEKA